MFGCGDAALCPSWFFQGSWHWDLFDDVVDHHLDGHTVAGRVRAEPDSVSEDVSRQLLDVLRIDLLAPVHQQRPDFHEASPGDGGSRRTAEVDTFLDQLRRRPLQPLAFSVVRT